MPKVYIKGVFMGADLKTQKFDGKEKTSLYVDVYQPDSSESDKMVQLKSDDVALLSKFSKDYSMGSVFEASAAVNAYQNKAYFKLLEVIEV